MDGPVEALFVFHLGCAPLPGKTGFFFEALGGGRCAGGVQHQPSNCPLRPLRPIVSDATDGMHAPLGATDGVVGLGLFLCSSCSILNRTVETTTQATPDCQPCSAAACAQVMLSASLVADFLLDLQAQSVRVPRAAQKDPIAKRASLANDT